jgi:glucuronate isomerase
MLKSPEFSVRNIMRKMNVKLVCTTEDPLDSLEHHKRIREARAEPWKGSNPPSAGFEIKVHTAFRPDRAMAVEDTSALNVFIDKLEETCNAEISDFNSYIEALQDRHHYFHH